MRKRFYDEDGRLTSALAWLDRKELSDENKRLIRDFTTQLSAEGVGRLRVVKYIYHLGKLGTYLALDFSAATKADIIRLFGSIEESPGSPWTKRDDKVACKRFYKWLRGSDEYPSEVKWLKATVRDAGRKLPEDMLTSDEIKRLSAAADNPRDRALVLLLAESGCRIGELGTLRIRHIEFDKYGAVVIVNGKTGPRRVRICGAVPAVLAWLSVHPLRADRNAALWIGIGQSGKGQPLSYSSLSRVLHRLTTKAGIEKRVHPHLFRHSRATELAPVMTEPQLKMQFGWKPSSTQPGTYVHLSGRDIDGAILRINGIQVEGDMQQSSLKPSRCARCDATNGCDATFCERCGLPLSMQVALVNDSKRAGWDAALAKLFGDEDTVQFLLSKAKQLGISLNEPEVN